MEVSSTFVLAFATVILSMSNDTSLIAGFLSLKAINPVDRQVSSSRFAIWAEVVSTVKRTARNKIEKHDRTDMFSPQGSNRDTTGPRQRSSLIKVSGEPHALFGKKKKKKKKLHLRSPAVRIWPPAKMSAPAAHTQAGTISTVLRMSGDGALRRPMKGVRKMLKAMCNYALGAGVTAFALFVIPISAFSQSIEVGPGRVVRVYEGRGGGQCEQLRRACENKDALGERGEGNCRRYRETCRSPVQRDVCAELRQACLNKKTSWANKAQEIAVGIARLVEVACKVVLQSGPVSLGSPAHRSSSKVGLYQLVQLPGAFLWAGRPRLGLQAKSRPLGLSVRFLTLRPEIAHLSPAPPNPPPSVLPENPA